MILTCPECGTQYQVKDGAIPPGGRQVRCAACKHSWHQDPEGSDPASEEGADETLAAATLIEPRSGVEAEERAYEATMIQAEGESLDRVDAGDEPSADDGGPEYPRDRHEGHLRDDGDDAGSAFAERGPAAALPVDASLQPPVGIEEPETLAVAPEAADWSAPPEPEAQQDDFSPFPDRDDEADRGRSRPILRVILLILLIAAIAAAFWLFAPAEWKARLGLAAAGASPLALVTTHMDRQRLESGNELLTITGRVVNPTGQHQAVPPLQALLKTRTGKLVYRWTIPPPARTLAPGASADFNSTEVDVPPGGDELTITLGSGQV